ncbi:prepilin-type N-terminal cleavage/methylation domain-containing protein [Pseudomonas syringae]|nr:prepilin-type N-terminal cleavage/methylation domain-containing protein [Pseudomonas syringae]MBD8803165.1 prepilin-type N-terminal cleavage/methylation domain-containing protein [Pseudomonas syringae]MBD8813985.1 prepilin-type N-terminal cleavage/methylation domain-containing protein [Pseudomonas syringae]
MQNTQVNTSSGVLLGLKKRKQRGFGLMEFAIVVLLVSLLAGLASLVLPGIFASIRATKITDELNLAIPAIQTAYQNKTSYAGLTTAQVAQNGWIGSGFTEVTNGVPTGNLVTQWGTMTFVTAATNTRVTGTLNNVPTRECIKIANTFSADQYLAATVNGTAVKTGVNGTALTVIGTQCSSTTTNLITFTFGRA